MTTNFATLILVGPGDIETDRLREVVISLSSHEPDCRELVLIDDGMQCSRQQVRTWMADSCNLTVIKNPRNGRGDGWADGTTVGVFVGLKHLSSHHDLDFVLRIDTDSAIFGRFADRISKFLRQNPNCGLAGTHRKYPDGSERVKPGFMLERQTSVVQLLRFLARVVLEERDPKLVSSAIRRRSVLLSAVKNGYRNGDYVQGGGHAISPAFLRKLATDGFLDDPFLFFHTRLPDDTVLTALCHALGLDALDYNGPGEVFAVINNGLPGSPVDLYRSGYAIAHSVKGDQRWSEIEIRSAFAKIRQEAGADRA